MNQCWADSLAHICRSKGGRVKASLFKWHQTALHCDCRLQCGVSSSTVRYSSDSFTCGNQGHYWRPQRKSYLKSAVSLIWSWPNLMTVIACLTHIWCLPAYDRTWCISKLGHRSHSDLMTYICVIEHPITGSSNGLSRVRCQVSTWTNPASLITGILMR